MVSPDATSWDTSAPGDSVGDSVESGCSAHDGPSGNNDPVANSGRKGYSYGGVVTEHEDFLVAWSTVPGHKAIRNEFQGSPFIQTLSRQLEKATQNFSLDSSSLSDVVMRVNDPANKRRIADGHKTLVTTCHYSALKKKIYFPPLIWRHGWANEFPMTPGYF